MVPADQRLHPGQAAAGQLDHRLVADRELLADDGPAQGRLGLRFGVVMAAVVAVGSRGGRLELGRATRAAGAWWALRPVWVAACAVLLVVYPLISEEPEMEGTSA